MKKLLCLMVLASTAAFGQAVRYDSVALNPRGAPIPNATITLCLGTATGTPCSPTTTSFTDITLGTGCASGFPVVLQGQTSCQSITDGLGNFGFWLTPGAYKYSISGPQVATPQTYTITVPVGATSAGAATSCIDNGLYVAGSSCYATIALAMTAAASAPGGPACTMIPGTYTGTDSYYADTACVIDFRHGVIGTGHDIQSSYPACQDPGCAQIFHYGNDLQLNRNGPSDLVLGQNVLNPGAGQVNDTATNLVIGVNSNVAVTNQTGVALDTCGAGICFLIVGRGTANEELVTTYTINSPTSITLTCAKTHTAPVAIEQVDVVRADVARFWMWRSFAPPVSPGYTNNMQFVDINGGLLYELPGIAANAWPNSALNISTMPISAWNGPRNTGGPLSVIIRNSGASSDLITESSNGTQQTFFTDTALITANGYPLQLGANVNQVAANGSWLFNEGSAPGGQASAANCSAVSATHTLQCTYNNGSALSIPQVIANGTKALNTASITTATCDAGLAATATGTASTDTVDWSFNAAPTATNKYGAFLVVYAVPSTNTVTFYTCNPSATTSTPTAMTVNWSVRRP